MTAVGDMVAIGLTTCVGGQQRSNHVTMTTSEFVPGRSVEAGSVVRSSGEVAALGEAAARLIGSVGVVQQVRAGSVIWRDSEQRTALWIVRQGVLATVVDMTGERRSLLGFHYPGDIVLGAAGASCGSSVVAITRTELKALPLEQAAKALMGDAVATSALVGAIERRVSRLRVHCATLARLTGEERLATFLVEVAVHLGRQMTDRIDVTLPVGREDIADYLGLNADTVSRIFSRLRREDVIAFDGRSNLHILEWGRLRAMSPFGAALADMQAAG